MRAHSEGPELQLACLGDAPTSRPPPRGLPSPFLAPVSQSSACGSPSNEETAQDAWSFRQTESGQEAGQRSRQGRQAERPHPPFLKTKPASVILQLILLTPHPCSASCQLCPFSSPGFQIHDRHKGTKQNQNWGLGPHPPEPAMAAQVWERQRELGEGDLALASKAFWRGTFKSSQKGWSGEEAI